MTIPTDAPAQYPQLFEVERERLLVMLQGLDENDWRRDTCCPGWNILDIATHIVGGDLGILARHRDQHFGTEPPPGTDEASFIAWLDTLQTEWVQAARRMSPRLTIDLLRWTGPQIERLFDEEDSTATNAMVSWASSRRVPAWLNQARELSEWWIHRQQIREALRQPSDLRADLARPVLDGLKWAYPKGLSKSDASNGADVEIRLTGPEVTLRWRLVREDGSWKFSERPSGPPDAFLTLSTDQAWRLLTNNLHDTQTAEFGSGDGALLNSLLNCRAIIGEPKNGNT